MMQRQLILVLGLLVLPVLCRAQGGGSWWKQLFKPRQEAPNTGASSVPDEVGSAAPVSQEVEVDLFHLDPEDGVVVSDHAVDHAEGIQGDVIWRVPEAISALDSGRVALDEIRIPGYRVQLFMGKLDSARRLKRTLEEADSTLSVHLTPYPPLFGVTLGNYARALTAHRVREAWRRKFPNALVVPLGLPLDALFPEAQVAPYIP